MKYLRILLAALLVVCVTVALISCVKENIGEQDTTQGATTVTTENPDSDTDKDGTETTGDPV